VSIWFEGYGCTANQGETIEMRNHAMDLGHEIAISSDSAETVVLGTCTVIESTQNRMERRISELMDQGKTVIVKEELPLGEFYDVEIADSDWAYLTAVL
jgi:tRNA A37 methylthiotransferase MiaB